MNTIFLANMVISTLFGLGFTLLPVMMANLYGATLTAGGYFMTRLFGAALLSMVVLLWYARSSDYAAFINATSRSMFTYWLIGSVIILLAQLAGLFNWVAWATFGLHAVFVIWYAFKIFKGLDRSKS